MAVSQSLNVTEVSGSVDSVNNTSKVRILWQSTQTGESRNEYTRTAYYYVSINGEAETTYSVSYKLPRETTRTIADATITVPHKDDGSGTVTVRTWMDTGISAGVVEKSETLTLTTIDMGATLDSIDNFVYANKVFTVKYTPKSPNHYLRLDAELNVEGELYPIRTISLDQQTAAQQTCNVTFTADELEMIYNRVTNSIGLTIRFTLRTYSDASYSNQIGEAFSEIDTFIPNDATTTPVVSWDLVPEHALESIFNDIYIQGKSKVKATVTANGRYGATIRLCYIAVEGARYYASDDFTSACLTRTGSIAIEVVAIDSRGNSYHETKNITVLGYSNPSIQPADGDSEIFCARCDASGNLTDDGTYLKIRAKRSYSRLISDGIQHNYCQIRFRYKVSGGDYSEWSTLLASDSLDSDEVDSAPLLNGALDSSLSYTVQVGVSDDVGTAVSTELPIATGKVYMHRCGPLRALGIGMYVEEENTVAIADDLTLKVYGKLRAEGEKWVSLGLSDAVSAPEASMGRISEGDCCYRVANGNHVYVAFNCAFAYAGSPVTVNASRIPDPYKPMSDVYELRMVDGRGVAYVLVDASGDVIVDHVQSMASAAVTESYTVTRIDGYIDYWV